MLRVRDIMTTDVLTVDAEMPLRDAMEMLAARHVSGAPVMSGNRVAGVVSATDFLSFAASTPLVPTEGGEPEVLGEPEPVAEWEEGDEPPGTFFSELWSDAGADVTERFSEVTGPEWDRYSEHTVSEVMTRTICSVKADAAVELAADMMRTAGVHRLLVMEGDNLVGILTTQDIANAVADHRLTARTYVFGAESKVGPPHWQ
jgi:CBS domain-containing protein